MWSPQPLSGIDRLEGGHVVGDLARVGRAHAGPGGGDVARRAARDDEHGDRGGRAGDGGDAQRGARRRAERAHAAAGAGRHGGEGRQRQQQRAWPTAAPGSPRRGRGRWPTCPRAAPRRGGRGASSRARSGARRPMPPSTAVVARCRRPPSGSWAQAEQAPRAATRPGGGGEHGAWIGQRRVAQPVQQRRELVALVLALVGELQDRADPGGQQRGRRAARDPTAAGAGRARRAARTARVGGRRTGVVAASNAVIGSSSVGIGPTPGEGPPAATGTSSHVPVGGHRRARKPRHKAIHRKRIEGSRRSHGRRGAMFIPRHAPGTTVESPCSGPTTQ